MISNSKISTLVNSQVPFFVRNDHANFVTFLEKYYEYLEQESKLVNTLKNIQTFQNIDLTEDQYAERLYSTFMRFFPKDMEADKRMLLKHIKDFYRARGTEKSIRFLLSAIHDVQQIEFYYPKKDILRASDGKWFIQRSIRIDDIRIDGELAETDDPLALEKFIGIKVTAQTTGTTALVERVDRFYEEASLIKELVLSNIDGKFKNSEVITGVFSDGENFRTISAVVYNFVIDELKILEQGTFYNIGDPVVIRSNTGNGACVTVGSVTSGDITEITVVDGGSGYQVGDNLKFIGTTFGGASPARANVLSINDDNSVHPNTYIIDDTQISLVADDIIGNTSEYETYSYANLAIQYETKPPTISNLKIYSSNVITLSNFTNRLFRSNVRIADNGPIVINNIIPTTSNLSVANTDFEKGIIYLDEWTGNSNVYINNGYMLSVNAQTVFVSNSQPDTNVVYISPATANLDGSDIVVLSYNRQPGIITSYNVINDHVTVYPGFTGNVSGYPVEVLSVRNWTDLYVNVDVGISSVNSISLLQANNVQNTSNLTITSVGSSNTLILSAEKQKSNVYFTTGTQIIVNGSNLIVTSSSPTSDRIRTTPAITGTIDNTHIIIWQAEYIRANVEDSNVYFGNSNTISINQVNTFITFATPSSNVVNVYPDIPINPLEGLSLYPIRIFTSQSNVGNVKITNAYATTLTLDEFAANSNVYFRSGDYLNVNNTLYLVNSYNLISNSIILYPGIQDSNNSFDYFEVNRTPYNSTSNLTVNTGATSTNTVNLNYLVDTVQTNVKVAKTEYLELFDDSRPSIFLDALIGTSNVELSNGTVISVNGQIIMITGSNGASQNVLYVTSPVSSDLWSNDITVLTYSDAQKSYSNIFFETHDSIIVGGETFYIESSNALNNFISVTPALDGKILNAPFDVIKRPNNNTIIANSLIYFTYKPTGPVTSVRLIDGGSYLRTPDIQVEGNSKIYQYGILGSLNIANPGFGYTIGDVIAFTNVLGGVGEGALAEVYNVNTSGSITEVKFKEVEGYIIGGSGYDINFLPTANVISGTGSNGVIEVKSILGTGATFQAKANKVGGIRSLVIRSRGAGYEDAYADLTANGDGNAVVSVSVVSGDIFGVYAYPGRWLGDDGQISSANYLQNRDYYQTFSYVIKTDTSIEKYRKVVKDLVHPAGTTLFGEHLTVDQPANTVCPCEVTTRSKGYITQKTYEKIGNTINVKYDSHTLYVGNTVYLEFTSGGNTNVQNGIYSVLSTPLPDYFTVKQYSPIKTINISNSGLGYNSNGYIIFADGDGKNANATYNINSSGSIVSINIKDYGTLYTNAPTATANGDNTTIAVFNVTLKYANNTNGNVLVTILV